MSARGQDESRGGPRRRRRTAVLAAIAAAALAVAALAARSWLGRPGRAREAVKLGVFIGGRTAHLSRAYIFGFLAAEGVRVTLFSKSLHGTSYEEMAPDRSVIRGLFGKATGEELIEGMLAGRFHGVTVGDSSFLAAVDRGLPVVAVAELGHDRRDMPGHAIVFRRGVEIRSPADMRGKVFAVRRAGPGEQIFVREFFLQQGLDPDRDVVLKHQVPEDLLRASFVDGTIDGAFAHLNTIRWLVRRGYAYIFRRLDWMNAEMSHALLVFERRFLQEHPDEVRRLLRGYVRRLLYEQALPAEVRLREDKKGLQIETDFEGMDFPQCEIPPFVRPAPLYEMQRLLVKHGALAKSSPIEGHVDNRLLQQVAGELGLSR